MKKEKLLLLMGIFMLFFACQEQRKELKTNNLIGTDTLRLSEVSEKILSEKELINKEEDNLPLFLKRATEIAKNKDKNEKFFEEFEYYGADTSSIVRVKIERNFFFSKDEQHLKIIRENGNEYQINYFSSKRDKFIPLVSHKEWRMSYVNDTVQDINGDGLKDFVVNWYGNNGCCLKAFSAVFLLKSNMEFTEEFQFINPTFSPKEHLIRGICYGHPGNTEMYKYAWKGYSIDTLEYISYEKIEGGEKTGKVLIEQKNKNIKIQNTVPVEYHNILGYDWFTGEGY
ncbi:hypothetical protein [Aureivirga sp. CE67]|uniref:hypothetical protein n=1 Tax=Aureivirga sp. CE67 TaxID=1788983 RepID=UPI0018CB554D|nr:hypothetical protein [Aureivirga sp. CE67]